MHCSNSRCNKATLSIHGKCNSCGKRSESSYNPNPQESKFPTTERGKRRMLKKHDNK